MKFLTTTIMAAICVPALAQLPNLKVDNFSADYRSPAGSARADGIVYEDYDFGSGPRFEVYQQAGEFVLRQEDANGEEYRLDSLPALVYDWEALSVERVDLSLSERSFEINSKRVEYISHDGTQGYVSGLDVKCESLSKNEILDSFLEMCLNQKMSFYLPFIDGVSVNNVNIWTNNNSLQFSLKNGVWIKGYGKIFHEARDKLVRIRVDKAKAGFFNVTAKFFSEIKEFESETVSVERPWIEIKLP